jgi:tetratricopeptide (TPR) repeat protein
MYRLALGLLLLLGAGAPATARPRSVLDDPVFRQEARRGLDRLYAMDFDRADAVFGRIAARYPDHPVGPFLRALGPWWGILIDPDDPSRDAAFLASMDRVIEICDRRLEENPEDVDAMFFRTGAHAFRGRVHSYRSRWTKAAQDGLKAMKGLQEVRQRDPDNDDLYFGVGLFDYLADVVPDRYPVLKPFAFFFPKGNRERGLRELARAMEKGEFVNTESAYALLQMHYGFEKDFRSSLRYASWLRRRHPDNSVFHLFQGRVYAHWGQWDQAGRIFEDVAARHLRGQAGYTETLAQQALYTLAAGRMRHRRYAEALAHLENLEKLTRGSAVDNHYKVMGRLRQGMALDVLGRRHEAVRCYRDVLKMKGRGDSRSQARSYLSNPYRG